MFFKYSYQESQRPRRRRPQQQRRRRYRGPRQDGGEGGGEYGKEQPEVRKCQHPYESALVGCV